jgi:hypothetical protein
LKSSAFGEKLERFADRQLPSIVGPERKEMLIVADKVAGAPVDRAEEEHHVVGIHRVMSEMEECDRDDLGVPDEKANEGLDVCRCNASCEQFLRIFGEGIEAVEDDELTPLPAIEDFGCGTGRMAANSSS